MCPRADTRERNTFAPGTGWRGRGARGWLGLQAREEVAVPRAALESAFFPRGLLCALPAFIRLAPVGSRRVTCCS